MSVFLPTFRSWILANGRTKHNVELAALIFSRREIPGLSGQNANEGNSEESPIPDVCGWLIRCCGFLPLFEGYTAHDFRAVEDRPFM